LESDRFFGVIHVEDTSDENARDIAVQTWQCVPQGMEEPTMGITDRRESSVQRKRRGGVMLCQRALLERTSSAGNEPNRANFGTRGDVGDFNAFTSSALSGTDKMMIN